LENPIGKKVLLISPPRTATWNSGVFSVCEPLGLAYLAAVLEKNGFKVEILDCFILGQENKKTIGNFTRIGLTDEEIKAAILKSGAKIVGISSMFTSLAGDSINTVKLVREVNPKALVVIGGAHATLAYESILQDKDIDIVVLGEGEETFLKIVQNYSREEDLSEIEGIAIREKGLVKCNAPREHIQQLDLLPYPARHLLPMDLYFKDQEKTTFGFAMRLPVATIMSSRGCPYNCIFCSTSKVWKRDWRGRSAKNVADEIELLVKDFGVKEIAFEDDNFIVDKKRVKDLCNEIINRKIGIKWTVPAGLSTWIIDKDTLVEMKNAGFYRVCFPIESGNNETLKFIRKPVNLNRVTQIIDDSNRIGLWTTGNFVFGFPDENQDKINDTLDFAKTSGLDMAIFYVAQPFAGSDLYSIYEKKGLLRADGVFKRSSLVDTVYDTEYFKAAELTNIRNKASSRYLKLRLLFYLTPRGLFFYLFPKINSIEKIKYFLKLIKMYFPAPKLKFRKDK